MQEKYLKERYLNIFLIVLAGLASAFSWYFYSQPKYRFTANACVGITAGFSLMWLFILYLESERYKLALLCIILSSICISLGIFTLLLSLLYSS